MKITWIGGPTFVLELGSFRIISDPVFADAIELDTGPATRLGPQPPTPSGPFDLVSVTNGRPDHFEPASIRALAGSAPVLLPATGVAAADVPGGEAKPLCWDEELVLEKNGESLTVVAAPARATAATEEGNGYFVEHVAGDRRYTAYWTGDARWSDDIRDLQRARGYANLLVPHIGAEPASAGGTRSVTGKDAMQFVYRMQPNAIVPVHHHTFSHYAEGVESFAALIGRTIYEKRLRVLTEGESFEK